MAEENVIDVENETNEPTHQQTAAEPNPEEEPIMTTKPPEFKGVPQYGQLRVEGTQLVNKDGEPIQLVGISSHGLHWFPKFVNKDSIQWLRDTWGINLFRAAMYVAEGGYSVNPGVKEKVKETVEIATDLGMYVIIDWHILHDNDPNIHKDKATAFFEEMAELYKDHPNVLYEIANEPNGKEVKWKTHIKPYSEEVITTIRSIDPDGIILVGTGTWSQDVHLAADDLLEFDNIMYVAHFYAGTHRQFLRDRIDYALDKGAPIFVTEWGTSDSSGDGGVFPKETLEWLTFMKERNISWANWSLADKKESSALLKPGAPATGPWNDSLSASGKLIQEYMLTGTIKEGE